MAIKITVGFLFFILFFEFVVGSIFFSDKLEEIFPNDDPVEKFNSFVLYGFSLGFLARFFMQKVPVLSIQPYLHLPLKKSSLVHFVLGKSLMSFFNFIPLIIFIPFILTAEQVLKKLHLRSQNTQIEEMVRTLVVSAARIARPKAVYRAAYIDDRSNDSVVIDGVKFTSHVLRLNLDKVERVFPYVATCGRELDELNSDDSDVMKSFCLDLIKRMTVASAVDFLTNHMKQRHALGQMSHMNPGSLTDWPITQQKQLFALVDDVEGQIGVVLSENCVMRPLKSVSGIYFPTEVRFESCQLCPREKCTGRRAPYSQEIAEKYSKS